MPARLSFVVMPAEATVFALTVAQGLTPGLVFGTVLAHGEVGDLVLEQESARVSDRDNGVRVSAIWGAGTYLSGADCRRTDGNKDLLDHMEVSRASDAVVYQGRTGTGWITGDRLNAEA